MIRTTVSQTLTFAALCCALALGNVWLNPSALALGTNYAPSSETATLEHEFQSIDGDELQSYIGFLFDEEPYVVVLDARSSADYEIAHISGAYLADHYHQQKYIEPIQDLLMSAPIIVVYCKGGDCEDSIFLARDLAYKYDLSIESLYIYEGGMNDWQHYRHPITTGSQR